MSPGDQIMSVSRRKFLGGAAGAQALLSAQAGAAQQVTGAGDRPNILYVIQEDIGPQLACYGEPLVRTPNLDRFAAQSVRFTSTYTTGPVCSASRSALMSGCYQNHI